MLPKKKNIKKPVKKATRKTARKKSTGAFKLGASLDISHAERVCAEMRKYISKAKGKIILDASEVERITTPCIQILLSVAHLSKRDGLSFKVSSPTDVFCTAMEDIGLSDELKEWRS